MSGSCKVWVWDVPWISITYFLCQFQIVVEVKLHEDLEHIHIMKLGSVITLYFQSFLREVQKFKIISLVFFNLANRQSVSSTI